MDMLYPFKPLSDEEVQQKVISIKAAHMKAEQQRLRDEREARRWKEEVSEEEKLRRTNLRESLLPILAGNYGVDVAKPVIDLYESMCLQVTQLVEGWPDEEPLEEELSYGITGAPISKPFRES